MRGQWSNDQGKQQMSTPPAPRGSAISLKARGLCQKGEIGKESDAKLSNITNQPVSQSVRQYNMSSTGSSINSINSTTTVVQSVAALTSVKKKSKAPTTEDTIDLTAFQILQCDDTCLHKPSVPVANPGSQSMQPGSGTAGAKKERRRRTRCNIGIFSVAATT